VLTRSSATAKRTACPLCIALSYGARGISFDVLNRSGIDHKCDRRMDGQTDRQSLATDRTIRLDKTPERDGQTDLP